MKPLYLVLAAIGASIVAVLASRRLAPRGPGAVYSDEELGSVAAVPGLADLEKKEPGFVRGFLTVMKRTGADPDKMAALMSEETGFQPKYGLLGWIDPYAKMATGLDVATLRAMAGIDQLEFIEKTIRFAPGYLKDPPMQGWGHGIGESDSYVLATKGDPKTGVAYDQNYRAYDQAGKGYITAGDVRKKVYATLDAARGKRITADGRIV